MSNWVIYCVLSLRRRILLVRRDSVFLSSLYWSLPLPLLPLPRHQSDHGSFRPVAGHTPIPTHTTTLNAATHLHGTDAGRLLLVLTGGSDVHWMSWQLIMKAGIFVRCVCILLLYCIFKQLNRLHYFIVNYYFRKLLILWYKIIILVFFFYFFFLVH